MKSGFAIANVPCLKNLDILSPRIDAQKWMDDTLKDPKENVVPEGYIGLKTYLVPRYIWAYPNDPWIVTHVRAYWISYHVNMTRVIFWHVIP